MNLSDNQRGRRARAPCAPRDRGLDGRIGISIFFCCSSFLLSLPSFASGWFRGNQLALGWTMISDVSSALLHLRLVVCELGWLHGFDQRISPPLRFLANVAWTPPEPFRRRPLLHPINVPSCRCDCPDSVPDPRFDLVDDLVVIDLLHDAHHRRALALLPAVFCTAVAETPWYGSLPVFPPLFRRLRGAGQQASARQPCPQTPWCSSDSSSSSSSQAQLTASAARTRFAIVFASRISVACALILSDAPPCGIASMRIAGARPRCTIPLGSPGAFADNRF